MKNADSGLFVSDFVIVSEAEQNWLMKSYMNVNKGHDCPPMWINETFNERWISDWALWNIIKKIEYFAI